MKTLEKHACRIFSFAISSLMLFSCEKDDKSTFKKFGAKQTNVMAQNNIVSGSEPAKVVATPGEAVATPLPQGDIGFKDVVAPTPNEVSSSFSAVTELRSAINNKEAWVATTGGNPNDTVYRIVLDKSRGYPVTRWTMAQQPGKRTYVSEIGLLIGATSRATGSVGIYRVSDDNPQAELLFRPSDIANESRICVASFRVGTTSYVGGIYVAGSVSTGVRRKFVRFPIDKSKPNKVDLDRLEILDLGPAHVSPSHGFSIDSYTCFMDQKRNYFWYSAPLLGLVSTYGTDIAGVNVTTMTPLSSSAVPNASHVITAGFSGLQFSTTKNFNYPLAADGEGNIITANGFYTAAEDPVSGYVFGSGGTSAANGKIYVTKNECFSKISDCTGKHFVFDTARVAAIGPMSSLSDGRIVGFQRGNPTQIFLLSLKDLKDPSKGLNIEKIMEVPNDAYMYTDFTGATLYAATAEETLDFTKSASFRSSAPITSLSLLWRADSGIAEPFRGLTLSVRCYQKGASSKPAYAALPSVADAGLQTKIALPMCSGVFDQVDVKIEPSGGSGAFSRTASFELIGEQTR